jgi:Family of unknown function (DUF6152)
MRKSVGSSITLLVFAALAPLAAAHHNSNAYFDSEQEQTLQGTVTRFDWRNPHSYLYIDVLDEDGAAVAWRLEGGPVALMRRIGWTGETLKPGDEVTVTIHRSRNPESAAGLLRAVEVAGRDVPPVTGEAAVARLAASGAPTVASADGLDGTWVTLLDLENIEVLNFFNEPGEHALTDAGRAAVDGFDERTMHPGLECIPYTAPLLMVTPDTKQIEIRDDVVMIRGEFDGIERVVYLDGREAGAPTLQGHSLGRWEDGTLVIETDRFEPHRMGNAFSLPSGAGKHLTERLALTEDGTALTYAFELTDPEFMGEPFAGEVAWAYRPDIEFADLPCNRDNSRLYLQD